MRKIWKPVKEIQETRTLNVAGAGGGLYLHLPKDLCELYGINGGDTIKVQLRSLYKRDYEAERGEETKGGEKHGRKSKRDKKDTF